MIVSDFYYCSFDLLTHNHMSYIKIHDFQAALHNFFLVKSALFQEYQIKYKLS